jgi:ABC-type antimicrobial peptide transport system permease subunit
VRSGSQQEDVSVQLASPRYFTALGVSAARGRNLDDIGANAANRHVTVISDAYWQRYFDRSPAALGSTLILNDRAFTVIGIMPPGFRGVSLDYAANLWLPLASQPELDSNSLLEAVGIHWVRAMTRLKPPISSRHASVQATTLILQQSSVPVDYRVRRVELASASRPDSSLRDALTSPLFLLLGIVALLLVVACVNVAHLLGARSATRQRELSVRIAVGAGRMRLIRQLLTKLCCSRLWAEH